jgi:circadian clock protein KaiC
MLMHPGKYIVSMTTDDRRVPSGTPGLDEVLQGGFLRDQTGIINGGPGTGKTILALQFLAAAEGEALYIGFEEREQDVRRNAEGLGIDLSDVRILDLSAGGDRFFSEESYTVFPTDEVEGKDLLERIATEIDEVEPDRLVVDPLSELRSLLPDEYQFRRNISSLINELKERGTTTLCTTQPTSGRVEQDLKFLGDLTIEIRRTSDHRSLEVTKFRGSGSADGRHTYRIRGGEGARVYPKLVPGEHHKEHTRGQLSSDIPELDRLLGGGIERGSVTVISGPSGAGKTTLGSVFLEAAGNRGEKALGYLFEELESDYLYRSGEIDIDIQPLVDSGAVGFAEVESLTQSSDEFAHHVRTAVENDGVEILMIDGITGYRIGLRGEDSQTELTRELHALCRYLKRMGVTVILIDQVENITGDLSATDEQISYLADNILFLRYLEIDGEIQKTVGVLKKRFGDFEQSLRELSISEQGVEVGPKLSGMRGILTGVPERTDGSG